MVALGRLVMSTRERICGIELEEAGLRLTTLRTAEEVRDIAEMAAPPLPKADPQMLAIAEKIVEQQAGEFDPGEFVDRYEDALRDLIEEKKKGHVVRRPAVANDDTKVIDLMAALRKSLKGGDSDRPTRAAASDRRREPSRRGPTVKPRPRGGRHVA
jgi:DNA end-binding protein Ku